MYIRVVPLNFILIFYIDMLLNKSAADDLNESKSTPNVSCIINEWADSSEAVQVGLRVRYEQEDKLLNYSG